MSRRLAFAALLAGCAAAVGCAGVPPRVWDVAHGKLPAGVDRVIYADLAALKGGRAEGWIYQRAGEIMALGEEAGAAIRRDCGMDPATAELVFASQGYGRAVLFVRVPGQGEEEVIACAKRLLHASARRDGRFVVLTGETGVVGEMLWVTPQVFAFVIGMPDRPTLTQLAGGDGGLERDQAFASGLVNVEYTAPVWGVIVPPSGSEARGAVSFHVTVAGKQIGVEVRVPAGGILRAWGMARSIRRMLARWEDEVSSASASPEGGDVIIQFVLDEVQIDGALQRVLE
jgi:hypothetical protein